MVLDFNLKNFSPERIIRALILTGAVGVVTACASGSSYVSNSGSNWGAPKYGTHGSQSLQSQNTSQGATQGLHRVAGAAHQKIGRPYTIKGKTYIPARDDNYNRIGIASWYGPKFHGKKTANGEIFNQNAMTAAHPTLPLPSVVRVTNLKTGKQILVRVNDRGPFIDDRMIDLSKRAAKELGYHSNGITKVRVEYVGPAPLTGKLLPIHTASNRASTTPAIHHAVNKTNAENSWPQDTQKKYKIALSRPRTSASGWFVQAGAFSNQNKAKQIAEQMQIEATPIVQPAWVNNRYIYRVLIGPYAKKSQAQSQQREVVLAGFTKARVTQQN